VVGNEVCARKEAKVTIVFLEIGRGFGVQLFDVESGSVAEVDEQDGESFTAVQMRDD
jgi:hypothetical protein